MNNLIEEIKSHRLSEVIEKFVHLQNEGSGRKKCRCPFHHEKTPSFHLDDKKGVYHCFGCGASGNIFSFIKEIKHCDFSQAIEYLCDILRIDKSKFEKIDTKKIVQQQKERKTFSQATEIVANYYKECLRNDQFALDYVKSIREIDDATEKEFLLGLADDNINHLINYCKLRDVDKELLLKIGIIKNYNNTNDTNKKSNNYLFFRNRIMIPIHDINGNIVAFGGRIYKLDDNSAKYINSSDNEYFKKGDILFNLHRSKNYVDREQPLIIVEGYMDAISLWQAGFHTSIAPLGTSITEKHLQTIFRYCQNPIFVFDSDTAGQRATMRACEMMFPILKTGFTPRICTLEGAKDVDEFLKKYSKDDLQKQLNNAKEIHKYIIDVKKQDFDLTNPNSLSILQKNIYSLVDTIREDILKKNYKIFYQNEFNKIVSENQSIRYDINKKKFGKQIKFFNKIESNKFSTNSVDIDFLEKSIISLLIKAPEILDNCDIAEQLIINFLPKNQKLLETLSNKSDEQKQFFCKKYCSNYPDDKPVKDIIDCLIIQWKLKKTELSDLRSEIKNIEKKKKLAKKKSALQLLLE